MNPAQEIIAKRIKDTNNYGDIALIVLNSFSNIEEELNKEINKFLELDENVNHLIKTKQVRFSNGEGKLVISESVRAKDVYILCDVGNYSCTYNMFGYENHYGPDEHFQDLKRAICALGGRAKRITVIMPLLYASRQHRRKSRESLDCALALRELEALGVNSIITFDAHDSNVQNAIPLCSFDNLFPTYSILRSFVLSEQINYKKGRIIIIAPDTGAMDRAIYHANILEQDVGMFYKRRDFSKIVNGKNPIIEHSYLGKDVKGKSIIIVDDMIASGESMADIAVELKNKGAKNIYAISTFAFFTEGVEKFDKLYKEGFLTKVYTTNLTYLPEHLKQKPWIKVANLVPFVAQVIATTNSSASLGTLVDQTNEINEVIKKIKR